MKLLVLFVALLLSALVLAQVETPAQRAKMGVYGTSTCAGCHASNAMGGLGPPLAQTKLTLEKFRATVRDGKGMMPATPEKELSDADVSAMFEELQTYPWISEQIPIAYQVGQFLSPAAVSKVFLAAFGFFAVFAGVGMYRGLRWAGFGQLAPVLAKMGWLKAVWIFVRSLLVDGLLVASLWKASRHRWFMHGLMLYGFLGLILADILIAVYNPGRLQLPMHNPLKMLPMLSGLAVFLGVAYVMVRYRKDGYIDNGLTLGRDFLFLNLLFHTVLSGFLTVVLKRLGVQDWVMTVYLYHLASIFLLVVTGPFTRFQHVYMVPLMAALTRLTEAATESGVELGFEREPSPGRHHKSQRIAESVLSQLGSDYEGEIRLRYYP